MNQKDERMSQQCSNRFTEAGTKKDKNHCRHTKYRKGYFTHKNLNYVIKQSPESQAFGWSEETIFIAPGKFLIVCRPWYW